MQLFFEVRQSKKKAKATFIELPLDILETKYDPKWLQEKVVACWVPSFRFKINTSYMWNLTLVD